MCVVHDKGLVIHDDNRPVKVGYDPKVGSKHAHIIDDAVVYDEPNMGQVFIFLIHMVIKLKGLNHHHLCSMQCHMNDLPMDEVQMFLAPIPK